MTTSADLDDIIRRAESLSKDEQMHLILHLAKQPHLVHHADILFSFVSRVKRSRLGYVDEEAFTGTWAYDQIWDSLRHYGSTRPGGEETFKFKQTGFKFKQTGPKDFFPNGFKF